MNKGLKISLIVILVIIACCLALMGVMFAAKICPPAGPWPLPPWCQGGISIPAWPGSSQPSQTTTQEEEPTRSEIPVEPSPVAAPIGPRVEISGKWTFNDPQDAFLQPTILSFAGTAGPNVEDIEIAHNLGIKYVYQVSLWQDDRWHSVEELPDNLKQAFVTDMDGNPVTIQSDFVYLNLLDPAWQQQILEDMFYKLDAGADGIVVDELSGVADSIWLGGGFDSITQDGFRDYLAASFTEAELAKKGVKDIQSFNFKDYLIQQGFDDEYRQGKGMDVPLGPEFREFLQRESSKFIEKVMTEARNYARETLGREILVSANMHPFAQNDRLVTYYPLMDNFTYEHSYFEGWWRNDNPEAAKLDYGYPVTPPIRYAASLGKRSSVLMILRDYSVLRDLQEPAASRKVAHALAETYMAGGSFCYWDFNTPYSDEGPYVVNRQTIRPYFDFLHQYPELFLDNQPVKPEVAIIAPPRVDWNDQAPNDAAIGFAWMLIENNIPFDFTSSENAADYKVVFATGYSWSDTQVQALMDYIQSGGVVITGDNRFASLDENFVSVQRSDLQNLKSPGGKKFGDGSLYFFNENIGWEYYSFRNQLNLDKVMSVVSQYVEGNHAPENIYLMPWAGMDQLVIHILNNNFDGDYIPQKELAIRVHLPEGFESTNRQLYIIPVESGKKTAIDFTVEDGWLTFNLPELDIWSAAVFE